MVLEVSFEYNKEHPYGWGYYKCIDCKLQSSDRNEIKHKPDCRFVGNTDNGNIAYVFGPREAKRVLQQGTSVFSDLRIEHLERLLTEEERRWLTETPDMKLLKRDS